MSEFKLPSINLPPITFTLPERTIDLTQDIKALELLNKKIGRSSDVFQANYLSIFKQLERGTFTPLSLQTTTQIRAYLTIALQQLKSIIHQINFEPNLLERFAEIRFPMTRLSLSMLIQLYFERFDNLTKSEEYFAVLCQFLEKQVKAAGGSYHGDDDSSIRSNFARYAKYAKEIFNSQAPLNIVKMAQQKQQDLTHTLQDLGIESFRNERLLQITQSIYYIDGLKKIPLGEDHWILDEVTKHDIIQVRYDKSYWIGHKVVEVLIDRTINEGGELSEAWQNAILDIAGDPRMAMNYQWWNPLGQSRKEQMCAWLSRFDLKLFLQLLEQSAQDLGKDNMERMFKERKRFLDALFDNDFIRHSRLFFTKEAANYLQTHYTEPHRLDAYARVTGDASVIYLQLKNGWHLIEGTHNFSIYYFDILPSYSTIRDYEQHHFRRDELTGFTKGIVHDKYSNWKYDLLCRLINTDIDLPVKDVLEHNEYFKYKAYKERKGV